jgi:hypothetical protein
MNMKENIEKSYTYHAPKDGQPERYVEIRNLAKELAYTIDALCPDSRERSLAFTKLDECVMWANASIARNE